MTRLVRCPQCQGKGYREARGLVRIGNKHCGGAKEWCPLCRKTGRVTEDQDRRARGGE